MAEMTTLKVPKEQNPLPLLRRIRDIQRGAKALNAERDRLIRRAAEVGFTQEQIAEAAGRSQSRVQRIVSDLRGDALKGFEQPDDWGGAES